MQCQRCHFENVPGESRCFKCGSILGGQNVPVDVSPPRMSKWERPFRSLLRRLRLLNLVPEGGIPKWMRIMSGNAFWSLVLSIVPGLAHLAQGRFKKILLFIVLWILFLSAGVFFYGTSWGYLFVGFAIAAHAWIAFDAALLMEHGEFHRKMADILFLLIFYAFFYWGIRTFAMSDFVFGYTALNLPSQKIQSGDCLLGRRSLSQPAPLPRASLVFVSTSGVATRYGRTMGWSGSGTRMIVQIVGLPGEEVKIVGDTFVINDKPLDKERYPVPPWLRGLDFKPVSLTNNSYFINTVYNISGRGNLDMAMIKAVCVMPTNIIEAKAIMLWYPLNKRGFLESDK
jgi:hypothetical protein